MFTSIFHDDLYANEGSTSSEPLSKGEGIRNKELINNVKPLFSTRSSEHSPEHKRHKDAEDIKTSSSSEICIKKYQNTKDAEPISVDNCEIFGSSLQPNLKFQNESIKDYSIISDLSSSIVRCRDQIDRFANCCISEILRENERIRSISQGNKKYSEKFNKRIENLLLQQNEFEKFVLSAGTQLTISEGRNNSINTDSIIKSLQKESQIFKQFFPAYGLRQNILNEIACNQVTIISADCTYSLNVALPFILSNIYQNLISCEANEILSQILLQRIKSVCSSEDQESLDKLLSVLSVEQLLRHFTYTTSFAHSNPCIILNVSLKRSLIADIVLSYLRDLLSLQADSKLIILLSPYDDFSKFADYFSSEVSVSVLNLPNLCLPVMTVWKAAMLSPNDDFNDEVVKTIFAIHALCEPGDMIAFLPSLQDLQAVFELLNVKVHYYQCNDIQFFCINDCNLNPFVQLKNFSPIKKVFLLTNDYTGLFFPSVRYVIDCGIQKECTFDSKTDANVFVPTFISQVRSKVMKQLAGMFNVGICFRMYNKANYLKNTHLFR